jgi:hypothetical protein
VASACLTRNIDILMPIEFSPSMDVIVSRAHGVSTNIANARLTISCRVGPAWLRLARRCEKNQTAEIVYETPSKPY